MNKSMLRFAVAAALGTVGALSAFGATSTGTTQLSVSVAAEASLTINTATTNLTSGVTTFADFVEIGRAHV